MLCLVFSDSHGNSRNMEIALSKNRSCEVVFFLGDGLSDISGIIPKYPTISFICVRGNCDSTYALSLVNVPDTDSVTLLGKRIVLTHGHLFGAKSGEGGLISLAKKTEADILLFGHTHEEQEKYVSGDRPFYLFNPGSISGCSPTYGVINITESGILLSHGTVK